jgi:Pvc16 N-terminal domain
MSSPLAIAAVTATICDLLNNGLIDNDLAPLGSFSVTALPPDRIETGNNEPNRLNLFLYQVTPNSGWRNECLPSRDSHNQAVRLTNPPLALDLHYMLTAYGSADWAAEILLGYAMELLHNLPVLSRQDILTALSPTNPISVTLIPPDPQGRKAIDLANQIEQVKITPHYLSAEELSRLWTSMQARYRPTMIYQVSTILIQGLRPVRSPLPVLTRGPEDRGVNSQTGLSAPARSLPTLLVLRILPAVATEQLLAAELGDTLEFDGALLDGGTITAEFHHPLLTAPNLLRLEPGATATLVRVRLPQSHNAALPSFVANADQDWPAGTYSVSLKIERPGKPTRFTNEMPFAVAPRFLVPPAVGATAGGPQLTIQFFPQIWPTQTVEVFVGGDPLPVTPIATKIGTLTLPMKGVTPSEEKVPVILRIGGVDSQLVRDRTAQPPRFDPKQTVSVPV